MNIRDRWLLPLLAAGFLAAAPALASDARTQSDERCVAQCDENSDRCMEEAAGDDRKMKACDDKYSKCLRECR